MIFPYEISCVDKDGVRNDFKYSVMEGDEKGFQRWTFAVVPADLNYEDWFEFAIVKVSETQGKVTMMENGGYDIYKAKGIPDAMIEEAARVLNLDIISSTTKGEFKVLDTETRTVVAGKVWKRLVAANKAKFDLERDIYTYIR